MNLKQCVIVDIDGTLAEFDSAYVKDWVLGPEKHWQPFFEFMAEAAPIPAIKQLVTLLKAQQQAIVLCSGRPDSHRHYTQAWLAQHDIPYDALYLRPDEQDSLPDEEVKQGALIQIRNDGYHPWLVIDDRQAVVDFWRQAGLTCLQCAPGNF